MSVVAVGSARAEPEHIILSTSVIQSGAAHQLTILSEDELYNGENLFISQIHCVAKGLCNMAVLMFGMKLYNFNESSHKSPRHIGRFISEFPRG